MIKNIINSFILVLFVTTPLHAFEEIRLVCKWRETLIDYHLVEDDKKTVNLGKTESLYDDFKVSITPEGCAFIGDYVYKRWGEVEINDNSIECTFLKTKFNYQHSERYFVNENYWVKKIKIDRYTGNTSSFYETKMIGTTDQTTKFYTDGTYKVFKHEPKKSNSNMVQNMRYQCEKASKKF